MGETLHVPMPDGTLTAKVAEAPVFSTPRTPGSAPDHGGRDDHDTAAGVTITELPPTTRIALRTADPAGAGIGLPTKIGVRAPGRTALCLGPDEWLLEAPEADRAALLATLAAIAARRTAPSMSPTAR